MYSITLISTRHEAIGECNSWVLHQILEALAPNVTFEEMPASSQNLSKNLEGFAISRYSILHKIKRVPVDTDNIPPDSFFQDHKNALEQVELLEDTNGYKYRHFTDMHRENVKKHGFKYLNSIECININDEINNAIENGLKKLDNEKHILSYQLWKDVNDRREDEMLQNIHKFSKENGYERAIFTIGSGHRKTIIQKIEEYETKETFNLTWNLLDLR